ncbi:MAG: PLP-dependent aminotransferase family protein [Gemmatimonadota bacterium]
MARQSRSTQFLDVGGLHADRSQPLHTRLALRLRNAILAGNFPAGSRLPSTRIMAQDVQASRPTVERAFDELKAEGFLVRRRGSGTFVAEHLPEREQLPRRTARVHSMPKAPRLSHRGRVFAGYRGHGQPLVGRAFTPSIPAADLFPRQVWSRLLSRAVKRSGTDTWAYGASAGQPELRAAIAAHIAGARAVACSPDQIIVLSSAQQAVDLAARVLLDPGQAVWVEDPGYPPAMRLLAAAGTRVVPVPVGPDGLAVDEALTFATDARMAYVTPSHQYPGGGLMTLERRQALLAWAATSEGWILEDDYDGDLRYSGRPLASLQALDTHDRVIYVGTFNKMMFPGLRIAFMVAPPDLVEAFVNTKHLLDGHAPGHTQAALAEFIDEGHLATHLRRVVGEYDRRRLALLAALEPLSDELEIGPADAGLHLATYLRHPIDDAAVAADCARKGVDLDPLSRFYLGQPRSGFVLGFACTRPAQTQVAMATVTRTIRAHIKALPRQVVR